MVTSQESIVYTLDPTGFGTCTRTFIERTVNLLEDGNTIVGTPKISPAMSEIGSADDCCNEGFRIFEQTGENSDLLAACMIVNTEENVIFMFDQVCTFTFDAVKTLTL